MIKNEKGGILCINKPQNFTSQDAVNVVRRLYQTRQAGHTGTLDPMATGVLLVLVGRAVKASEYLMCDSKSYRAGIKFGITTDTEDISGNILTQSKNIPSREEIEAVLHKFRGDIMQIPPMYSAIKQNGKKLVDLAREGKTVEREARCIHISSLELVSEEGDEYIIDVTCSKGTYIRTLCADIGASLSCGATMSSLCRTANSFFTSDDTHTFEEIEALDECGRMSLLIPVERAFADLEIVRLNEFYSRLCKNGAMIYLDRIGADIPLGTLVRLYDEADAFFALGRVGIYEEGIAVKAVKFL